MQAPADSAPQYVDPVTGVKYPLSEPRWRAESGGPLMITPLPGIAAGDIQVSERSLWRYAAALPVPVREPVSLGEGCTPLVSGRWRGVEAFFKLEWFSPTGSFKDRGASVMISILREQGIRRVLEDSSGNGGAAIAAYAAAAGLAAKILVPESTPLAKVTQMRAYGAEIELVPGPRQATSDEAVRQSGQIFYASHNWQPYFLQGTKTLAYELWEDLGQRAPDNVVIPMGAGSNVLGCDIGFDELKRRGLIERRPRLYGVQPVNCAPLHASYALGIEHPVPTPVAPTIAEGTAIARPVRHQEVLRALRRSNGGTAAVAEEDIAAAALDLSRHGFYAEPTSVMVAAGFTQLVDQGVIDPVSVTVLLLTGTGLKATQRYGDLLGQS
jgi:threonine synthase